MLCSSGAVAAALGLGYLDAEPLRLLRALVTAGIAWVLCWLLHSALPRTRREWVAVLGTGLPVLWMGAVIGVVATGLLYWLVQRVDVVTVTSVRFLVPAVTAVLDRIVRGQSLHGIMLIGMAVVICALFLLPRGRRRGATRSSLTNSTAKLRSTGPPAWSWARRGCPRTAPGPRYPGT
ncbi:DMT family transporter [Kocuria rhizophila]|nr:DMT family transporter [Kocuria rhizophila]MCC5674737.1 DMT family transporter [Kocuria rhizophila]